MTGKCEAQLGFVAVVLSVLITVDLGRVAAPLDVDEERSVMNNNLLTRRFPCRLVDDSLHPASIKLQSLAATTCYHGSFHVIVTVSINSK